MKKAALFFLFLAVVMALGSCKKNSGAGYLMTCKVNGVAKSFNAVLKGYRENDDSGRIITLGAQGASSASTSSGENMTFFVKTRYNPDTLLLGSYNTLNQTRLDMAADYFILNAGMDYSTGYSNVINPDNDPFIMTFTYADKIACKGTFSGTLYYKDGFGHTTSVKITDGVFYAKF
jgi:hypothetical protein